MENNLIKKFIDTQFNLMIDQLKMTSCAMFKSGDVIKTMATKKMICPECHKGTIEKLTEEEKQKLANTLGDKIKGNWYGCDECKFYVNEDSLKDYI